VKAKRSLLDAVRFLTKGIVGGEPIPVKFPKSRKELTTNEILERAKVRQLSGGSGKDLSKPDNRTDRLEEGHGNESMPHRRGSYYEFQIPSSFKMNCL